MTPHLKRALDVACKHPMATAMYLEKTGLLKKASKHLNDLYRRGFLYRVRKSDPSPHYYPVAQNERSESRVLGVLESNARRRGLA